MENEIREIFTSPITVFKFLSITTLWETYGLNLLPELKTVVTDKLGKSRDGKIAISTYWKVY